MSKSDVGTTTSKRYKKLSPEEEARLYGTAEQHAVVYPPVELPDAAPGESSIDNELGLKTFRAKPLSVVGSAIRSFGIRRAASVRRIQVGLDFGTSSTKVMYRELGVAESRVRLLDFKHGLSDYPGYCLPAIATFDKRANLYLADSAVRLLAGKGWGAGMSRLKMLVAGRTDKRYLDSAWEERFNEHVALAVGGEAGYTPDAVAATYLAAVMKRIRVQLQHELGADRLELIFNTCVPVDQSERTPIVMAFERVIATSAELERRSDSSASARQWLETASELISTIQYDIADDEQRVFIMPEAVATAAGYITSIRRRSGIHAVVDIGAGTTDVSICLLTLKKRGGATTYWYAARSIPMGAARIEGLVANRLGSGVAPVSQDLINRALSNDPALASQCGAIVADELKRMWNGTLKAWSDAYKHDARQSAWQNDVTVFLTGGGAMIPAARSIFAQSWQSNWGPYPCDVIPSPESFDTRSQAPFHRLSVAFGLATPIPELGEHIMPSKSPDHTPLRPPIRQWRQEGDQMLPRWGWT